MILGGALRHGQEPGPFPGRGSGRGRLQHPNIVQIFEIGEADGLPFFTQEYVEGGTLAARLDGTPAAPRRAAARAVSAGRPAPHRPRRGPPRPEASQRAGDRPTVPRVRGLRPRQSLEGDATGGTPTTEVGLALGTPLHGAEQLPHSAPGSKPPIGPACDVYAPARSCMNC